MPTRSDVRVQYYDRPVLLPVNQSETAYMSMFDGSSAVAIDHTGSTCTLYDRDGSSLATGSVSDDGNGYNAAITVPAGTATGSGYWLIWDVDLGPFTKEVRQAAIVTPYPVFCPAIATDWLRLHPNDTGYPSGQTDFGVQLEEAWTEILWDLSAQTRFTDADIWDIGKIRPILIAKWERIVFRALATNIGAGRHAAEADAAARREKEYWQRITLSYDTDGDGDRDVRDERYPSATFPPPLRGF